jgi:hypothetical protein
MMSKCIQFGDTVYNLEAYAAIVFYNQNELRLYMPYFDKYGIQECDAINLTGGTRFKDAQEAILNILQPIRIK